jgi:hypothetical protein
MSDTRFLANLLQVLEMHSVYYNMARWRICITKITNHEDRAQILYCETMKWIMQLINAKQILDVCGHNLFLNVESIKYAAQGRINKIHTYDSFWLLIKLTIAFRREELSNKHYLKRKTWSSGSSSVVDSGVNF